MPPAWRTVDPVGLVSVRDRVYLLATREPYGVWGGLTEDERESVYSRERHLAS